MKIIPEELIIHMIDKGLLNNVKEEYKNISLTNKLFWENITIPRYKKISEGNAKSLIKKILTIVDTGEEVEFFKSVLPFTFKSWSSTKSISKEMFLYYLWQLATIKVAENCTLKNLPKIAIEHAKTSQSKIHLIEWLQLLQKYEIEETKDYIIGIYNTAEQEDVANIAKTILLDNNIIEKKEEKLNLVEIETIFYKKILKLNLYYFKERVNNNNLLTDYLVSLIISAFEEKINIEYEINSDYIQFNFMSESKENNDEIVTEILSALEFAFSGNFSHYQKISKMKNMKDRKNLNYYSYTNSGKDLLVDFKKEMKIFSLKEKIEKELNTKVANESKQRNKI